MSLSDGGDEGYPSPDDDITLEGSVNRQKLREESRRKRKLCESFSTTSSTEQNEEGGQAWAEMVKTKFNTPEKIGRALLNSKLSNTEMQQWLSMVSTAAAGGGKKQKLKNDFDGEDRLMPLETFNCLLESQHAKFRPWEYVIPGELMDKKSFFYKSRHDPDLNFIFVKRDREGRISEKWENYRSVKIEEAAKKGRIADKAIFRTINKEQCHRFGLGVDEGWSLYKKSWCLLMGLKPTANVDRFFRREHPFAAPAAPAAAPAAVAVAAAVAAAVDDYFDDVPGAVVDDGGNNYEFEGDASPPAPPPDEGDEGSTSSSEEDDDVSSPETPSTPETP